MSFARFCCVPNTRVYGTVRVKPRLRLKYVPKGVPKTKSRLGIELRECGLNYTHMGRPVFPCSGAATPSASRSLRHRDRILAAPVTEAILVTSPEWPAAPLALMPWLVYAEPRPNLRAAFQQIYESE